MIYQTYIFTDINDFAVPELLLFLQKFTLHFLKNHILSGRFPLNNLNGDLTLTTLAGTKLHIKKLTNVRSRIGSIK